VNWSSFKYLARQGLQSMVRNRLMSVASIGVLTVCLIITGVAALFTLNINSLMDYLGSQNEAVVYLQDDLSDEGLAQVDGALRSISGLRDVIYVTKQEALDNMKESMEDKAYLWDAFEGSDNPFSATYRVILDDVAMMPEIETVFLATAIKWSYLSSTIVREAAHYGQDVSRFVPRNVEKALIVKREAGEL